MMPLLDTMLALLRNLSLCLLLILLLRPLLRRLSGPSLVYALWAMVPLVLLASLMPHPPAQTIILQASVAPALAQLDSSAAIAAAPAFDRRLWLLLWLAGSVLCAAWFMIQQWRFMRRIGPLQSGGPGHYFARHSQAGPALIGLWRPRIVLPADFAERYNDQEQDLILEHERIHLRRGDLHAKAMACLVRVLFWFNPLVHLANRYFIDDQELACDRAVLRSQPHARRSYAEAILKTEMANLDLPFACTWQSRHPLKERIMNMSIQQPRTLSRRIASVATAAVALGVCYGAWAAATPPAVLSYMAVAHAAPATVPVSAAPEPMPTATAPKAAAKAAPAAQKTSTLVGNLPVPALAAAAPVAPVANERGMNLDATYVLSGGEEKHIKMSGITSQGAFISTTSESKDGCDDEWNVGARPDETVMISGKIVCAGVTVAMPRIVTRIGTPGTIEVQRDANSPRFKLSVLVSYQ